MDGGVQTASLHHGAKMKGTVCFRPVKVHGMTLLQLLVSGAEEIRTCRTAHDHLLLAALPLRHLHMPPHSSSQDHNCALKTGAAFGSLETHLWSHLHGVTSLQWPAL